MKRLTAFLLLYSLIFQISTVTFASPIPKPDISSEAAVLMDADTGIIIYQKNPEEKLYPASITKIMTAMLAINAYGGDPGKRISFSKEAVDLPYDSSSIAMNAGDTLTVQQALYGLMISSANEVANALAENIGESINHFVDMMNGKAEALGAKNTHFANPNGLFDPNHYTCAYDMALFMREAVKSPVFVDAGSKIKYDIPPTETQPEVRGLNATNKLILPGGKYYRDYIKASKTGFTDEAKHTLAAYGEKDGHRLISVILKAEKNKDYEDTIALMDYGFGSYQQTTILQASSVVTSVTVVMDPDNAKANRAIPLYAKDDVSGVYPSCVTERSVSLEYKVPVQVDPPIKAGDPIGTLVVKYQGAPLSEISLYASESVDKPEPTVTIAPATTRVTTVTSMGSGSGSSHGSGVGPISTGFSKGFSFGFIGEIFTNILRSIPPIQFNPIYFMIIVICVSMVVMVYIMSIIIHGRNKNREKELLKAINKGRKK